MRKADFNSKLCEVDTTVVTCSEILGADLAPRDRALARKSHWYFSKVSREFDCEMCDACTPVYTLDPKDGGVKLLRNSCNYLSTWNHIPEDSRRFGAPVKP
jgi:hypothetical protein